MSTEDVGEMNSRQSRSHQLHTMTPSLINRRSTGFHIHNVPLACNYAGVCNEYRTTSPCCAEHPGRPSESPAARDRRGAEISGRTIATGHCSAETANSAATITLSQKIGRTGQRCPGRSTEPIPPPPNEPVMALRYGPATLLRSLPATEFIVPMSARHEPQVRRVSPARSPQNAEPHKWFMQ